MKKILKIAKVELSLLFFSPIAWIVLTLFAIQCALGFFGTLLDVRNALNIGDIVPPLTQYLLGGNWSSLPTQIVGILYLYMPILTMGLMSREFSSGSIKLLLTSPVKVRAIILGKFLAIAIFGLSFVAILGCFDLAGIYAIQNVDYGVLLSALLGTYLLVCAYAGIGLYMSCLTSYQIIAFVSTLAVLAALNYAGSLWQDIDIVRDLTYFLVIGGRAEKMFGGLITTKDVLYLVIVIASFLLLCMMRLRSSMESKPWGVLAARYVLLAVGALFMGYLTSRPALIGYLDMTRGQTQTLAKTSQALAKQFDGELKITTYGNVFSPYVEYVLPAQRNADLSKWELYRRFIPGLRMNYVYFYQKPLDPSYVDYKSAVPPAPSASLDAIASQAFENLDINGRIFLRPADITRQIDLKPEGNLTVRRLEYRGKSRFLRFYLQELSPDPSEADVNAALKGLLMRPPKVVFLTGHGERRADSESDRDYWLISKATVRRAALVNQGFDIESVNLQQQDIPDDADIVVLGDPTVAYASAEIAKVRAFIDRGGNMLLIGEPGRQQLLNPILLPLGIELQTGMILSPDKRGTPGFLSARISPQTKVDDPALTVLMQRKSPVAMQGAAAINYSSSAGFAIAPLLVGPAEGWLRYGELPRNPVTGEPVPEPAYFDFNPQKGDEKGQFPVTVSVTRKVNGHQQRIVVIGDGDFMSNSELSRAPRPENTLYYLGLFRWLANGEFPVYTPRPAALDLSLSATRAEIKAMAWIYKAAIPALLVIVGMIVLFRRRGR